MISKLKEVINKNSFIKGVSSLIAGNLGAQAILFLAAPILTRLYTPEDFGVLAVYVSLITLFSVVASLRYELAIPIPKDDEEAANLLLLSLFLVFVLSIIACGLVFILADILPKILGVPKLEAFLWLVPLGIFFMGGYKALSYWSVRKHNFNQLSGTRIIQSLATILTQIFGAKFGGGFLLFGNAFGHIVAQVGLVLTCFKIKDIKICSLKGILSAAKRYKQFPLFSTWSGLFNSAGTQLPTLMFSALFGAGSAGLYALAHRVLAAPMNLLGDAIGKVFFANAADANREGRLGELVVSVHEKLSILVMPFTLLLIVLAPEVFSFAFGENWRVAGEYARWMAPWLYMVFISSPLSVLFYILEKENIGMYFQGMLLILRILAVLLGYYLGSFKLAIILFSLVGALYWFGFLIWIFQLSGGRSKDVISTSLYTFSFSSICIIPITFSSFGHSGTQLIPYFLTTILLVGYYIFNLNKVLKK